MPWVRGIDQLAMASIGSAVSRVQLTVDAAQAEAALSVAECWNTRKPVLDRHWMDLLTSEGHRLWKRRMQTVGQPVDDAEYARFLFSSKVGEQREEFRAALREWRSAHWEQAALRALDWLPENAKIVARVFIVLSPTATSFYHSEAENAAVFFALDAALSEPQRENLMVHELHHVGYFGLRGHQRAAPALPAIQSAAEWTAAFAEGLAMLAAAGGAGVHPHAASTAETRARWDRDIAHFAQDLRAIEQFLFDVVNRRLTAEAELKAGNALLGVQGPWYTVGWMMGSIVEREFGRQALLDCMAEGSRLMARYNQAAADHGLTLWSSELIAALT